MFVLPGKKEKVRENSRTPITEVAAAPVVEEQIVAPPILKPVIVRDPLSEQQQREIFQWMLEEKRRMKPENRQAKQLIDEDKAIIKKFIRAESIPQI